MKFFFSSVRSCAGSCGCAAVLTHTLTVTQRSPSKESSMSEETEIPLAIRLARYVIVLLAKTSLNQHILTACLQEILKR